MVLVSRVRVASNFLVPVVSLLPNPMKVKPSHVLRRFSSSSSKISMSLRAGIVGLPNVGKSTLFNAVVENGKAQAANFPFCTIEPNVGIVAVPDPRLQLLSDLCKSQRAVSATIEFVDIAGLVKGASQGEGLGNKFLSHIREVDSILQVVRCFEDNDIVHVSGKVDPKSDIDVINLELVFSDLDQDLDPGRTIGNAEVQMGLYLLKAGRFSGKQPLTIDPILSNKESRSSVSSTIRNNNDSEVMMWHYRLGHPNFVYLEKLFPALFTNKKSQFFRCEICQFSKHTHQIYPSSYKISSPFSMINSDVWGPSRISNITGARWFVSFIDDHTRLTWLFLMKEKSEVSQIFQNFYKMVKNQFKTKIQILRTDNGREYYNAVLGNFLSSEGLVHQSSCVETPQQNGVSKSKNRHVLEVARSLLFSTNVPKQYWGKAVLTASYLINRLTSRVLKFQTPCNVLLKSYPNTRLLLDLPIRIFGCSVYVHNTQQTRSKLDPRSIKCIFVGYSPTQKGYKCYSHITKKLYVSKDTTFMETQPFYPKISIQGGNEIESVFWESRTHLSYHKETLCV